jgi:hypothetical protein
VGQAILADLVHGSVRIAVVVVTSLLLLVQQTVLRDGGAEKEENGEMLCCAHGGSLSPVVLGTCGRSALFFFQKERERREEVACHCSSDPKAARCRPGSGAPAIPFLARFSSSRFLPTRSRSSSVCPVSAPRIALPQLLSSEIMTSSCFESFPSLF